MPNTNKNKRNADRTKAPKKIQDRLQKTEKELVKIAAERLLYKTDSDVNKS